MKAAVLVLLLMFAFQTACADVEPHATENGFRFYSADTQALFAERLKREGIAIRVRDDGTVLYRSSDEDRVNKIRLAILKESFVPSARFVDTTLEEEFLRRLADQKIEFGVQVRDGKRWIVWSQKDDKKVQQIREALLRAR